MKKLIFILTALCITAAASAQELPRIAVYVIGDGVSNNTKNALGTRLLASLVNSGRYNGIERSDSFLAEIEKEQIKQRSGAIDDSQISALGRQFGVKFVCIANITPVLGAFQISARVVNVETAEIAFIGESGSNLRSLNDLEQVADQVVKKMFGEFAAPVLSVNAPHPAGISGKEAIKTSFWIGTGLTALGVGVLVYGVNEEQSVQRNVQSANYTPARYNAAKKSAKNRNAAYIIGASVLSSGIFVYIFY
ncbi:MAG: CsgG/HfaB family protein [Chitinispirillia bacterium]|nr:CsgG/HfaB family protein [Chitinispirillia bacterium]